MSSDLDELLPAWRPAARAIVARGLWCVVEVCACGPTQLWEARLVVCERDCEQIASAIAQCIADWPQVDLRIAGYTRDGLRRERHAPAAVCHVAPSEALTPALAG